MLAHFSLPTYMHEEFLDKYYIPECSTTTKEVKLASWWSLTVMEAGSLVQKLRNLANMSWSYSFPTPNWHVSWIVFSSAPKSCSYMSSSKEIHVGGFIEKWRIWGSDISRVLPNNSLLWIQIFLNPKIIIIVVINIYCLLRLCYELYCVIFLHYLIKPSGRPI